MTQQHYESIPKNTANYVPLTPISFLHRTADIFPERDSVIYNERRYNWAQTRERCVRMANSLVKLGLKVGDTISVLAYNTPELFEAHFAIPMSGAVINAINTRLEANTLAYILEHSEAKVVMVDRQLWPVLQAALDQSSAAPTIVIIDDDSATEKPDLPSQNYLNYEDLIDSGDAQAPWLQPSDEWQALALNYTSGTTGRPKGVVYHHRGSYLMSMGTVAGWSLPKHPVYLYTVPMFHCNGWGHAWTMAAVAGTVICIRAIVPKLIFELIEKHEITHFGGAPIVLNMLANAPGQEQKIFNRRISVMTAGAPPAAKVLENMDKFGFDVMHVYGLTESYGHILQAAPQDEWASKSIADQAELKSRQGVRFPMTEAVDVIDMDNGEPVAHDGKSMGEIAIRGNTLMKGYFKDQQASADAFQNGWFMSGDLAVIYPDGYIQIKDRAKDIIISGGENITSIEIENVLYKHDAVGEAAVVAMADEKWGETPCAFVELKAGAQVSEGELIEFCTQHIARFKKPSRVVFGGLPKTATGKIQKNVLRERAKAL